MKTMKRYILFSLLALIGVVQASAQDITTIHLKNGTKLTFGNGRYDATDMRFTTQFNEYSYINTSLISCQLQKAVASNEYACYISFHSDLLPTGNTTVALLIGTSEGLTLETADAVIEGLSDIYYSFQIGAEEALEELQSPLAQEKLPIANYPLQKGQTYYFRAMARIPYLKDGQQREVIVYENAAHRYFRVPLLMAECDLVPWMLTGGDAYCPSTTAWTTFCEQHFPGVPEENLQMMPRLWQEWVADHLSEVTVSQELTFDDGVLRVVSAVPEAFYTWLTTREVVLNRLEQIYEIRLGHLDSLVTDADPKWQIPGNSYMRFVPEAATSNTDIAFRADELIPGLTYTLEAVFAPETILENNEENAAAFRNTKLRFLGVTADDTSVSLADHAKFEIPATETTRLTVDNAISGYVRLKVQVSLTVRENANYNRIVRLAELRLKPQKNL